MSGDPEQEYFADGMVEDIITALSRFKSLFVIARNSSFTYKGKAVDIKQVGRELGVRYVLEGSVRKASGRVRITGQLIEAATGIHLWADKFDGAMEDVFELQDKVTEKVVSAVAPKVTATEIERVRVRRPESLDGYDHVLRALAIQRRQQISTETLDVAIAHTRRAIELMPNYPFAYALCAVCYSHKYLFGLVELEHIRGEAISLAQTALELGADDAETFHFAAHVIANFDSIEQGIMLEERALALNPSLSPGWALLGYLRLFLGEHERGIECFERALRLNPTGEYTANIIAGLGLACFFLERNQQGYDWAKRAYHANPTHAMALRSLAVCAASVGNRDDAHRAYLGMGASVEGQLKRMKDMLRRSEDFARVSAAFELAKRPE